MEDLVVRAIVNRPIRAVLAFLALGGAVAFALAQAGPLSAQGLRLKSDSKVKATAAATAPDASGRQVVTVTLNIDKGWHIYANPVGNEDLDGAKTIVTITAKAKPQSVKVDYPAGAVHVDKILKSSYRVYEDRVTIRAFVQRAAGDTGALQVNVQVNACDASKCLPPADIKLTVP